MPDRCSSGSTSTRTRSRSPQWGPHRPPDSFRSTPAAEDLRPRDSSQPRRNIRNSRRMAWRAGRPEGGQYRSGMRQRTQPDSHTTSPRPPSRRWQHRLLSRALDFRLAAQGASQRRRPRLEWQTRSWPDGTVQLEPLPALLVHPDGKVTRTWRRALSALERSFARVARAPASFRLSPGS